jgi:hypothetical protein
MRDDDPRPVWMSLFITHCVCFITAGPITKLAGLFVCVFYYCRT